MDTMDCSFVTFAGIVRGALYFQVEDPGLDTDSYIKSSLLSRKIKCSNGYLVLTEENQLIFDDDSDFTFYMQLYPDNKQTSNDQSGKPIALFVRNGSQQKVVCCSSTGEIRVDTLDLPDEIGDNGHEALFFLKNINQCSANCSFTVEPSLCRSRFLGFEKDAKDPSYNKLVLRPKKQTDQTDEASIMKMYNELA